MSLSTDLSQSPYFDDYDESKNFHKITFKPAFAVQARELNQLQTILQEQVSRFGENILKEGTIVKGGNFVEEPDIFYIKLRDNSLSGTRLDVELFKNKIIIGSVTGLKAIVLAVETGLESQKPNLNTLFVKYLNTVNNIKEFDENENINVIDSLNVIDYTLTGIIAGSVDTGSTPAVGRSYGVRCGEGTLFQKGHFIRFADNLTIVSKYSNTPDNVVVGFKTNETIVSYKEDASLTDNAAGFNNFNAPGADRLQLTPVLVSMTVAEGEADETFFAIQQYSAGRVTRRRLNTQFNSVESLVEQRTAEESGNYYVKQFTTSTEASANTSNFNLIVEPGIAYVNGKRVETVNNTLIEVSKPSSYKQVNDQDIIADFGQYVVVQNVTGMINFANFDTVNLRDNSATIGTARVRSITRASASTYRVYLFDVRMNTTKAFKDTTKLGYGSAIADVVLENSIAVLKDTSYNRLLFPIGKSFIKSIISGSSDFYFRAYTSASSGAGTSITVTLPTGQSWLYSGSLSTIQKDDFIIINTTDSTIVSSYTGSITGQQLTISGITTGKTYSVIYTVKKTSIVPSQKTLKTVYVKVDCNTNTGGIYSLGLPDVYSIDNIWRGSTYSTSNSNVTSNFILTKNDNSNYYGHSYISATKNLSTLTNSDKLLIQLKVFDETFSGDCYTVDSYVYTGSGFALENIPVFNDGINVTYLRDAIDFRPYATATSAYSLTEGGATIVTTAYNPLAAVSFGAKKVPVPFSPIETTYQYNTGRKDALIINEQGDFQLIMGVESEFPVASAVPNKTMEIAEINIPPAPSLPYVAASRSGKPEYGITSKLFKNRRYTMADIGQLDTRLSNMETLVALSLLEKSAADLAITDSAGLNRFKNGIFVDNFDDLTFADSTNNEFKASIDIGEGEIHPLLRSVPIDLVVATANNATLYSDTALLTNNSTVELIKQQYATKQKNCTTGFYKFNGSMIISPDFDSVPDTQYTPDVNINIDLATPFVDFTTKLNNIIPPLVSSSTSGGASARNIVSTTSTTTTKLTTSVSTVTKDIGDFVTDVRFNQFMRSQEIQIYVSGLRPSTVFWVYFDGKDVSNHVALGTLVGNTVQRLSPYGGQTLTSNSSGILTAVFKIPAGTFYVGERKLEVIDVDLYGSSDAQTSYASAMYNGFNFSITKTGLTTTTRVPSFNINNTSTVSIINSTTRVPDDTGGHDRQRNQDPIAQTFFLDSNISDDTDVFVSKVDVFFASKSATNGVTIEIRETLNGYPTGITVPFSSVHLAPSSVIVNAVDGTTPTTVTFKSPIALKTNQEYALVIKPDANDPGYKVWVAKTGETDIATGVSINQDSAAGLLFTSTNDKAWTPYQDEDLKFTLFKTTFTASSGSVTLTNDNHEFLTTANTAGIFLPDELVFSTTGTALSANVTIIPGNTVVTGNVNFQSIFTADEYLVVEKGGIIEALKVASANTTALILVDIPTNAVSGNATNVYRSPVAKISYFNTREDTPTMVLKQSNAKTGLKFNNGDTFKGVTSKATTVGTLINLPISFIQPNIYRSNFSKTRTDLLGILYDGSTTYNTNMSFKSNNYLAVPTLIRSKSLNTASSDFFLQVSLDATASNQDTSPMVDFKASKAIVYTYLINNDATNEKLVSGNASSKYLTKIVTLADKMDAEDIRVILTAYKPTNSDIKVYVKLLASDDSTPFADGPWSELIKLADVSSSAANRSDYVELSYVLDPTVQTAGNGAYIVSDVVKYISADGAIHQNFKKFAIKIVMMSPNNVTVPRIKDIRALALS